MLKEQLNWIKQKYQSKKLCQFDQKEKLKK